MGREKGVGRVFRRSVVVSGQRIGRDWPGQMCPATGERKENVKSEDGPTATEYAVMLALIIVVALTAIQTLGTSVQGIFTDVNSGLAG